MSAARPVRTLPWDERPGFGAAYYHEYHRTERPAERLAEDMRLMREAGFTVFRVGESVWSTWEPREGEFDLDWLQPVLDAAHAHGIGVIIGTPTYAVPRWLRLAHPETALEVATGVVKPYGARQDVDYSHPVFRALAERVIVRIIERYREHPAVVGWQVDNEPGLALIHNDGVFASFREGLRELYGSIEELNRRWGLTYWSHRLGSFEELWRPEGDTTPSYDLAWRRHQARISHDMIRWQAELVRSLVPEHHVITTCIAANQPGQDVAAIAEPLDVAGANVYYAAQEGLALPGPDALDAMGAPAWVLWSGAAYVPYLADVAHGMKQGPFVVTETNATDIGFSADRLPAWPGQRRQVVLALIARGARMIEYWHWHTNRFGAETYWTGVLGHSLEPGRAYRELAAVGRELEEQRQHLVGLRPQQDVTLVVDAASRWAIEAQPPFHPGPESGPAPATYTGDRDAYERMLAHTYRGLFDAGLMVRIAAPHQLPEDPQALAREHPVLILASLYIASDELLARLVAYAEAGGHLVLTPRSAVADEDAVVRQEVLPGALRGPAGVRYEESTTLRAPARVVPADDEGPALRGAAIRYADCLIPEGAQVLARYDADPFLSGFAAATTHRCGAGRVSVIGCVPDRELSARIAEWIAAVSLPEDPWRRAVHGRDADGERAHRTLSHLAARTADGRVLHVVHNWSWQETQLPDAPEIRAAQRLDLTSTDLTGTDGMRLGPWDAALLLADAPTPGDRPPGPPDLPARPGPRPSKETPR